MLADEADADPGESNRRTAANWVLTNPVTDLSCKGNGEFNFQGNYDYDAHAQVYVGGADPLGSQGYASVVKNPSSS